MSEQDALRFLRRRLIDACIEGASLVVVSAREGLECAVAGRIVKVSLKIVFLDPGDGDLSAVPIEAITGVHPVKGGAK